MQAATVKPHLSDILPLHVQSANESLHLGLVRKVCLSFTSLYVAQYMEFGIRYKTNFSLDAVAIQA